MRKKEQILIQCGDLIRVLASARARNAGVWPVSRLSWMNECIVLPLQRKRLTGGPDAPEPSFDDGNYDRWLHAHTCYNATANGLYPRADLVFAVPVVFVLRH